MVRGYALVTQADPLEFVGSVTLDHDIVFVADTMRARLSFDLAMHREFSSWSEALR